MQSSFGSKLNITTKPEYISNRNEHWSTKEIYSYFSSFEVGRILQNHQGRHRIQNQGKVQEPSDIIFWCLNSVEFLHMHMERLLFSQLFINCGSRCKYMSRSSICVQWRQDERSRETQAVWLSWRNKGETKWVSTSDILSVTPSRERWSRKRPQPITGSVGDFNFLTSTDSFVFGQIHFPIRTNTSPGQWGRQISIFSLGWRASTDSFVFGQLHFSLCTVYCTGDHWRTNSRSTWVYYLIRQGQRLKLQPGVGPAQSILA